MTNNSSILSISQISEIKYNHFGGWPFFYSQIEGNVGLSIFILGAPGTPYKIDLSVAASTPLGFQNRAYANSMGYTSPGLAWNWTAASDPNGFSVSLTGNTNSQTIQYAGATYSQIQIGAQFDTSGSYGSSSPSGPFIYSQGVALTETLKVSNLGLTSVPLPPSFLMMITGIGLSGFITGVRRNNSKR